MDDHIRLVKDDEEKVILSYFDFVIDGYLNNGWAVVVESPETEKTPEKTGILVFVKNKCKSFLRSIVWREENP